MTNKFGQLLLFLLPLMAIASGAGRHGPFPISKAGGHSKPTPSSKDGHSTEREHRTPAPTSNSENSPEKDRRTPSPTELGDSFDTEHPTSFPTKASISIDRTPSPTNAGDSTDSPRVTSIPTVNPTVQNTSITGEQVSTIYDVIQQQGDLTTFVTLVDTAGMDELLSNTSVSLTLFAPVNSGLTDVPPFLSTENWRIHLWGILLFHMLPYRATPDQFVNGFSTETIWGETIYFTRKVAALRSNYTGIYVNGFAFSDNEIIEELPGSNGIVNKVVELMIPTFMTQTVLDIVNGLESLTTLSELVTFVGAEEEFTAMQRTLFAPSNEAFAAIPSDALSALTSNPEALRTVLLYHLCPEVYPSMLLEDGSVLDTVLGPTLQVSVVDGIISLNSEAAIVQPNLLAGNGILHVIDTVLVPPVNPEGVPTMSPQPSDIASDIPSDLQSDVPSSIGVNPEGVPTMSPQPSDIVSDVPSSAGLVPEGVPTVSSQPSDLQSDVPSSISAPGASRTMSPQPSNVVSSVPSDVPSLTTANETSLNASNMGTNVREDEVNRSGAVGVAFAACFSGWLMLSSWLWFLAA